MKSFEYYLAAENRAANERYIADQLRAIRRNRAREERRRRRKVATIAVTSALAVGIFAACAVACDLNPDEDVIHVTSEPTTQSNYPIVPIPEKVLARMETPVVTASQVIEVEAVPSVVVDDPIEQEPSYTEKELEMLALVIYQEAGGDACSDDTRLKVGTVVMNRVADDRFPDTIEEVLTQERQYGRLHWTGLVWPERAELPQEAHAVARAYVCAERILSGERHLPEDVIFQSEYIQGEIVAEQDGFYFCRTGDVA